MLTHFRSLSLAAVETVALVAASLAAIGVEPTVALEAPTASQALALRRLREGFSLRVAEGSTFDASVRAPGRTLVDPVLVVSPPRRDCAVPSSSVTLDLTAVEPLGTGGTAPREIRWRATEGVDLPSGAPLIERCTGWTDLDPNTRRRALAFTAQLVAAHALGVGRTTYANVSRLLVDAGPDGGLAGQVIARLAALVEDVGEERPDRLATRPVGSARRHVAGHRPADASRRCRAEFGLRRFA